MPRSKTTAAPKTARRSRKPAAVEQPVRSPEEQTICDRYPDRNIKPGSWLPSGGRAATHGQKATVILTCVCGAERVVATSDVFQVRFCVECSKTAKKNKADKRKQEKE